MSRNDPNMRQKGPISLLPVLIVAASAVVVGLSAFLTNLRFDEAPVAIILMLVVFEAGLLVAWTAMRRSDLYTPSALTLIILIGILVIPAVLANTSSSHLHLDDLLVFCIFMAVVTAGIVFTWFILAKLNRSNLLVFLLIMLSLGVLAIAGAALNMGSGSHSGDFILVILVTFAIAAGASFFCYVVYMICTSWLRRRTTERIVIGQIATVVRQNLPLATGIALAAEAERGGARTHLRRIARLLAEGVPLSQALQTGYPDCSALPLSLIIAGESAGRLTAAVEQAEAHLFERERRRPQDDMSLSTYIVIVTAFATLMVSGIMVAVIPKFKEIFKDFNTKLPASTVALINTSEVFVRYPPLWLAPLLAVLLAIYWSLRPRRFGRLAWSSRLADWIRWHTPFWREVEKSRSLQAVLQVVRLGVQAGMGLPDAARIAENIDVNAQLKPGVAMFAQLLQAGVPIRDAARRAGMGEVAAVSLAGGQRDGNMDAALRYAVDYHGSMASRTWMVLRNLAWPAWTIAMSILVGWIVVALFQPLVALIQSVSM